MLWLCLTNIRMHTKSVWNYIILTGAQLILKTEKKKKGLDFYIFRLRNGEMIPYAVQQSDDHVCLMTARKYRKPAV
jgi:hypothetical protein